MKPSTKRAFVVLGICAVCTALLMILWNNGFRPLRQLEASMEDWQMRIGRQTPLDDRIALIGVDKAPYGSMDFNQEEIKGEPTLAMLQQNWPWSRAVWAKLIQKLGDAGAKVMVFDFIFAAPGDGDEELKQALQKYGDRVVLGYNIADAHTQQRGFMELQTPTSDIFTSRTTNSPVEDPRLGYINIWPDDEDGTFRRARYRMTGDQLGDVLPPNVSLESMDARVLRAFGRPDLIPSGFESRRFRYTGRPGTFPLARIGDVLVPKMWTNNFHNGADFKDKIVFIGPTGDLFQDYHDTPFRSMTGPEVHLNIINAALHSEFFDEPPLVLELFIIGMAGICAMALCFVARQPLARFALVILVSAGYLLAAWFFFNHGTPSVWLVAIPTVGLVSSSLTSLTYDYFLERADKRRMRKTFERYVSRDVVKELLDNPQTFATAQGGIRRPVTILFADVRGFTTLTESVDEHQLVKQLNEYFEVWVQTVFEHEGSLDKFIGDAVMAVWGNIPAVSRGEKKDAQNAVATALKMKPKLAALNESWKARGWKEFRIGIGINHGEVIVGEIGSSQKAEITAIGDAVNLASRLEGLTKKYHVDLLIGERMAPLVSDYYILRKVASVQPKGKTKAADVYTVMGDGAAQTVSMPMWLARYEEGVRRYRERNFSEAAEEFRECLRRQPGDLLSERYLEFCENLIKNPPGEDWTAAEIMTDK